MPAFLHQLSLAAPLFALVAVGYVLVRVGGWTKPVSDGLARFVFGIAMPALLFRLMSGLASLPPVDIKLLLAFFGGCLLVFVLGRLIGARLLRLDGVAQSVFALGGVFSNNVLLGVPLARITLGDAAAPTVALVIAFNALILWTLVTISVEWAKHGALSVAGFAKTARSVATNPIVASIALGAGYSLTGLSLPVLIDLPLGMLAQSATPLALIALGMGLAEYDVRDGWRTSVGICALKLAVHPIAVWCIARSIDLPDIETRAVVLLAALPVGVNVYLMSREFRSLEAPVAASLVLSTATATFTVAMVLAIIVPAR